MSGPEHYREAELIQLAVREDGEAYFTEENIPHLAAAQIHATLALAAATAYPAVRDYYGDDTDASRKWAGVAA